MSTIKRSSIGIVVTVLCASIPLLNGACSFGIATSATYGYICVNGTPSGDATATTVETTKCVSCNPGYALIDERCYKDYGPPTEFISVKFDGTGTEMQEIVTEASIDEVRTIELTVEPGNTTLSSLFFQFTNTTAEVSDTPRARLSSGESNIVQSASHLPDQMHADGSVDSHTDSRTLRRDRSVTELPIPLPIHIPAPPLAPPSAVAASTQGSVAVASATHNLSTVSHSVAVDAATVALGDDRSFTLHQIGEVATLYARSIRTVGEWSVIAWVHPDVYTGCSSENCLDQLLTQSDIEGIMDSFFKDGSDNDIFDWVTALIGLPWGDHDYDGDDGVLNRLISGDTRTLNLILTDIDRARYSTPAIVGYFAPSDARVSSHNRALTLFLHAPWAKFDTPDPIRQQRFYSIFLSVLAHELQHLVHYYQRTLQLKVHDPTWLNEQYSLIVEDVVSQNIFDGDSVALDDRGVNGLSAGTYPICNGRLPDFIEQSYYGISRWGGSPIDNEPLVNYAVNYSFGNFLLRNYNGVAYLINSYGHNGDSIASIEAGLGGDTFADAVVKWGTAMLLSDTTDAPAGYRVNNGTGGFTYTHNGEDYVFGSTNYYNYATVLGAGGCHINNAGGIFAVSNDTELLSNRLDNRQHGHSNIIHHAGTDVNGTVKFIVTLPIGSRLSVIAKRQTHPHNPVYF